MYVTVVTALEVINIATIPSDFEPQSGSSNYLKLTPGKHRIRILSGAIAGYVWWEDTAEGGRKPGRIPLDGRPPVEFADSVRRFLAFPVFNYELNRVQIWEVAQSSIQRELSAYEKDKDWGNLQDYDLEIERTGNDKLTTRYRISPKPKSALPKELEEQIELPNMGALYEGKDPFATEDIAEEELDKVLKA